MKGRVTLVAIAALAALAAVLPEPAAPPEPLAGLVIDRPGIESPVDASIWYCPWAQANAERETYLGVASMAASEAEFTFPVAIPGEPPDSASLTTLGPGAALLTLGDLARRGDSPGFVEFTDGPSAATATVVGDVVTADSCVAQGPSEWFFVGGSTATGEELVMRLYNPFPETAKVTITGFSEIGVEALGELRAVSVNPRSWRDISFAELLRQRQTLALSVRTEEGLIVPAMSYRTGDDEDWWMGTGLSDTWEVPVLQERRTNADLVIANPGFTEVEVTIDLFSLNDSFPGAFTMTIPPESPVRIGLSEVNANVLAARVSASAPVAVSAVATGPRRTAITAGAPAAARTWLMPGLRTSGQNEGTLWLLNSSDEPISVTIGVLTATDTFNSKLVLEPGRVVQVPVTDESALGYLVTSDDPFSAGWSIAGPNGLAFATGLAAPDE